VTDTYTAPPSPRHLQTAGKHLWRTICREWELEPGDEELILLEHACKSQDICEKAEKSLETAGSLMFIDRFAQPHERPEVRIIRQARASVAALVKQIGASQLAFERLSLAADRHRTAEERRANPSRRDRRGGGKRLVGG
jgi:phage terminase small subunit